ncbi:plasmid maintenance protein [Borreliella tanukii]|uniref:plasmid maintenance protein n=2 Tax=Borreliella tanukii TaxID=56146 RepID=UPI002647E453|nr:plasmid maintenance protein [Borreliella tanukii]WKC80278.1 plasmid maintenance protein [Borreliella tanukii]WKC82108.1 plasmid maintenance protein [Borreliella tanukii]
MIIKIENNVNKNFNNLITLEELLKHNQKNTNSNLIELKCSRLKSYLTKKRAIYQRMLKVCWAIELKNKEYYKSNKLKTYSTMEIYNIVNKCLAKDNQKISIRTLEYDISFLNQILLITTQLKHLGKDNGSFAFYIQNKNLWEHRFKVIQEAINEEILEYVKDKKIVSDFYKEIENTMIKNNTKTKSSSADESIADVIPKGIKDKDKIKNSIRKKIEKFSYKEYITSKLIRVHKIEKLQITKILKISNNEKTYINALRNLKSAIEKYEKEYRIEDISNHFVKEFKNKYSKKIWMMNGKTDKINDFNEIWETRFKKRFSNKKLIENYYNNYIKSEKNIPNHEKRINVSFSNNKGFKKINKIKIN